MRRFSLAGVAASMLLVPALLLGAAQPALAATPVVPPPLPVVPWSEEVMDHAHKELVSGRLASGATAARAGLTTMPVVEVLMAGVGAFVLTASAVGGVWSLVDPGGATEIMCRPDPLNGLDFSWIAPLYGANCVTELGGFFGTPNDDAPGPNTVTPACTTISGSVWCVKPGAYGTVSGSNYVCAVVTQNGVGVQSSVPGGPGMRFFPANVATSVTVYNGNPPSGVRTMCGYPSGNVLLFANTTAIPAVYSGIISATTFCFPVASSCSGVSGVGSVVPTTLNPDRYLETRVQTAGGTRTCTTSTFKEADGSLPAPCFPSEVDGEEVTGCELREYRSDLGTYQTVGSCDTTEEYDALKTAYPLCSNLSCVMQVRVGSKLCTVGAAECLDWQNEDDAECVYGPATSPAEYVLDLTSCLSLAHYYDPEYYYTGRPYADPLTGLTVTTEQSIDKDVMNAPAEDRDADGENNACFPTGWGVLNPIEWIVKPVGCAIRAAFVPRTSVIQATMASLQTSVADRAPMQFAAMVSAWSFDPPPLSCDGIVVPLSDIFPEAEMGEDPRILSACPGDPLEEAAGWSTAAIVVLVGIAAIAAIGRSIAGVVEMRGPNGD